MYNICAGPGGARRRREDARYSHMYNIDDTYHDHIRKLSSIRTKAFTKA